MAPAAPISTGTGTIRLQKQQSFESYFNSLTHQMQNNVLVAALLPQQYSGPKEAFPFHIHRLCSQALCMIGPLSPRYSS
jgi:hypothetical protein